MTIDAILSVFAPHTCIVCGNEGAPLCPSCMLTAGEPPPSRCAGCKTLTGAYRTCSACRSWLDIYAVYVATEYEGVYERLIRAYKFDLQRQASRQIAQLMHQTAVRIQEDSIIVCPLPTAPSRIRMRGFDHAKLLVKMYWWGLPKETRNNIRLRYPLQRRTNSRQLGSSRAQRISQVAREFYVTEPEEVRGKTILIVDDVTTTGASLAAAARVLKDAGAKRVYAVVFAQKV